MSEHQSPAEVYEQYFGPTGSVLSRTSPSTRSLAWSSSWPGRRLEGADAAKQKRYSNRQVRF